MGKVAGRGHAGYDGGCGGGAGARGIQSPRGRSQAPRKFPRHLRPLDASSPASFALLAFLFPGAWVIVPWYQGVPRSDAFQVFSTSTLDPGAH